MATIYNSDLSKELIEGAKIQQNFDKVPNRLGDTVVPVMEVNPKMMRRANIVRGGTSNTSSSTSSIYTTPTDKDFFLTTVSYYVIKDAASDNIVNTVVVSVDGSGDQTLLSVPGITLTASNYGTSINFPSPIKLTRGSTIRMSSSFTIGVLIRGLNITGYTVDNVTA
jgi:hypothetical protein